MAGQWQPLTGDRLLTWVSMDRPVHELTDGRPAAAIDRPQTPYLGVGGQAGP